MWEVLSFGDKPYGNMTNQEVIYLELSCQFKVII